MTSAAARLSVGSAPVSGAGEMPIQVFCPFLNQIFVVVFVKFRSSSCILDINPSEARCARVFSVHSGRSALFIVPFHPQEVPGVPPSVFAGVACLLKGLLKTAKLFFLEG